jgi:hypothetical protein
MDSNNLSGLIYHPSSGRIGYWKDPLICPNPFDSDVFSETVGHLLGNENYLTLFTTFGASEGEFPVFDIGRGQLQNLTDPHSTPSHQFKNQSVPGFDGAKDSLIHYFFFQNVPAGESWGSIELFQHRGVTGASEIRIEVFDDEVEEGGQLGVPGLFG